MGGDVLSNHTNHKPCRLWPQNRARGVSLKVGKTGRMFVYKVALAVGERMIRNIANRVMPDGIGAFDVELGNFQTVGQIIDQMYKRIAYASPSI